MVLMAFQILMYYTLQIRCVLADREITPGQTCGGPPATDLKHVTSEHTVRDPPHANIQYFSAADVFNVHPFPPNG